MSRRFRRPDDMEVRLFRQVISAVRRAGCVEQKVYGEEVRLIRCPGGVVDLAAQFEGENPEITYSLMGDAR